MFLSVFDVFKVGMGPSSSHTMGPMVAAKRFLEEIRDGSWPRPAGAEVSRVKASLHGSLAFTGKGHGSDRAVILGFMGQAPDAIDPDAVDRILAQNADTKRIAADGHPDYLFDPERDLIFDYDVALPGHANGMTFTAEDATGRMLLKRIYYSVGGGFVRDEEELAALREDKDPVPDDVPFAFASAKSMLNMAAQSGLTIAAMKRENEIATIGATRLSQGLTRIWDAMDACIERGLAVRGELPGGLSVKRRAADLHAKLEAQAQSNRFNPMVANEWLSVYAIAVNEENAAGGKVVTAPTNGAAGVVPAVIKYYLKFVDGASKAGVEEFLLTASAIGGIIKHNASISGAEVGCQGEVGSASAMAAAGLAACMGGTPEQVENAAEIALEHHLGMTCDPIAGLVQVPCIERNALGAVKAVTAASLALNGDGTHFVPLDNCIETMRQTGRDMSEKYKETSQAGLAVNVVDC
ncbi:MAG: L-serine ammonia-lyase [Pseudomonadota bacterium]